MAFSGACSMAQREWRRVPVSPLADINIVTPSGERYVRFFVC